MQRSRTFYSTNFRADRASLSMSKAAGKIGQYLPFEIQSFWISSSEQTSSTQFFVMTLGWNCSLSPNNV